MPSDESGPADGSLEELREQWRHQWKISGRADGGVIALSQTDPRAPVIISGSVAGMRKILENEDPRAAGGSGG